MDVVAGRSIAVLELTETSGRVTMFRNFLAALSAVGVANAGFAAGTRVCDETPAARARRAERDLRHDIDTGVTGWRGRDATEPVRGSGDLSGWPGTALHHACVAQAVSQAAARIGAPALAALLTGRQ
jgi:hypothetical protein